MRDYETNKYKEIRVYEAKKFPWKSKNISFISKINVIDKYKALYERTKRNETKDRLNQRLFTRFTEFK